MPDYQYLLRSWSFPPVATFTIELSAVLYLAGWWHLYRAGVPFVPPWRAVAFVSGLGTLWIALASPIDALNGLVLSAHMLQHMLLMMAAPPLILLGAPLVPMTRGLSSLGARQLLSRLAGVLVARRPAVAESRAMAPLGDGAVPAAGGPAKHRAVGDPCVLRSRA